METNKWFFLLLFVLGGCTKDRMFDLSMSSGACFPEVMDKYVYPAISGLIETQEFDSTFNPYQRSQLPDDILEYISTSGLIDALIHAPMFTAVNLVSSNTSLLRWHGHYDEFNSARELFKRNDAGDALVAYYRLVGFDCAGSIDFFLSHGNDRIMGLECLFTKQEILDKMGTKRKKQAVAALYANYQKYPTTTRIFPMAVIMYDDGYKPLIDHVKKYPYILNGYLDDNVDVDIIVSLAKKYF